MGILRLIYYFFLFDKSLTIYFYIFPYIIVVY